VKKREMVEELRSKSNEELVLHKDELKRDVFGLSSSAATSGEKKGVLKKMRQAKRQIARILTILREREMHEHFQVQK